MGRRRLNATFPDHFSAVAGGYAEFRPRYPETLFDWLAALPGRHVLAWDCATGNGQAAVALARRFERVVATDASADQIAQATPHPVVDYGVAPAERSGLADSSADLVTVAQALHWLDRPRFYAEVRRVLRPDGVFAAWTYGHVRVDEPRADAALARFYSETVGPFWPPERALVDAGYRTIEFPFDEIEAPRFDMTVEWPIAALLGYVGTWSATQRFRRERGYDPVPALAEELALSWGDPALPRRISWPLSLRVGRP